MSVSGDEGHLPPVHRSRGAGSAVRVAFAAGATIAALSFAPVPQTLAKTPGAVHCYGEWCHRVSTLDEMEGMVGRTGFLKASYYDDCRVDRFNTCNLTSSGEVFRPDNADNAASPIFPDGTVILAYYPVTRKAAVLRVNSAGPYHSDRRLDVSRATAEKLGFRQKGVAELMVTVVKAPEPDEARYRKLRRYSPVPGYMGMFSSFDAAHDAARANLKMDFGVVMSALDEGETTPLPPPERHTDLIGNLVPTELSAVAPKLITTSDAADRLAPIAARILREDGSVADLALAPGAGGLLKSASGANSVADRPPSNGHAEPQAAALNGSTVDIPDAASANDLTHIAALDFGADVGASPHPGDIVTAREREVTARESEARLNVTLAARFGQGFLDFIAAARRKARAGLPQRAAQVADPAPFTERLARFVADAKSQARAGVPHNGALTRLTMELRLKAQPPPRFARD